MKMSHYNLEDFEVIASIAFFSAIVFWTIGLAVIVAKYFSPSSFTLKLTELEKDLPKIARYLSPDVISVHHEVRRLSLYRDSEYEPSPKIHHDVRPRMNEETLLPIKRRLFEPFCLVIESQKKFFAFLKSLNEKFTTLGRQSAQASSNKIQNIFDSTIGFFKNFFSNSIALLDLCRKKITHWYSLLADNVKVQFRNSKEDQGDNTAKEIQLQVGETEEMFEPRLNGDAEDKVGHVDNVPEADEPKNSLPKQDESDESSFEDFVRKYSEKQLKPVEKFQGRIRIAVM